MGSKKERFDAKGREKVQCRICFCWFHRLEVHLSKEHGTSQKQYLEKFPGAPTISQSAKKSASNSAVKRNVGKEPVDITKPLVFGSAKLTITPDSELSTQQKADVPKHDDDWEYGPDVVAYLEDIAVGIEDGDNIFMFGPTGCGKTTLIKQLAAMTNTPVMRFQFSTPITVEDFVGSDKVVIDEATGLQVTRFTWGAFTKAWNEGYYIIFDEFTASPSKITLRLQGPLEGDDLVLHEEGGTKVPKHPRTVIFATDNTNGRGDDTGLYVGTNVINESTLDRFGTVIKYDYADAATESKILRKKTGVSKGDSDKMVAIACKIREAFNRDECYCTFGTRRLLSWAKKTVRHSDPRRAAKVSVLNKLNAEDAKFVDSVVQRYFGGVIK
jgi:MoxR-like ATPase